MNLHHPSSASRREAPLTFSDWFLGAVAFVSLLIIFGFVGRIDFEAEQAASILNPRASIPAEVDIDLRDCTPPHVSVTPIVTFTIQAVADDLVSVLGCTRYAETNTLATKRVVSRQQPAASLQQPQPPTAN